MASYEISIQKDQSPGTVIRLTGYLAKEGGEDLLRTAEMLLQAGRTRLILDLSGCSIITSPAVALLIDLAIKVSDDFGGTLALSGLDSSKTTFLTMTGMLPLALNTATVEEAQALIARDLPG